MVEEIYSARWNHSKYISQHQIRMQKKKALQSYKKITTIKDIAIKEADKASDEAEQVLQKFITSWPNNND